MRDAPRARGQIGDQRYRAARFDIAQQQVKHAVRRVRCDRLDEDANGTAAGETDLPRSIVLDAEFELFRRAGCNHVGGLGDDLRLDTAARNRSEKIAVGIDQELATDGMRSVAPGPE